MMPQPTNDCLLRALRHEHVEVTPIWMMRQAGRYLPEYRKVREQVGGFMDLCRTPDLACEVTLQPLRRFPLDAAILFSDILTVPDAMGLGLHFVEGEGPRFERPLQSAKDIEALGVPDPEQDLRYVMDTVRLIRHELAGRVPLIGFSGSPWTLATYMLEGQSSRDFRVTKTWIYNHPEAVHALLNVLTEAVSLYLLAQIRAGAQALMLFDTWGGILTPKDYRAFSLAPMERIVRSLKAHDPSVPVILFTKGGGAWLEAMAAVGCDALSLDWTTDLSTARARVCGKVALQGNLDPSVLYASPAVIRTQAAEVLAAYGAGSGHVFNLGHGIHPDVPPEHVATLVEAVHDLSRIYHL